MFDDFFGGMFDFNGDGHTDLTEQATGFAVLDEMSKEDDLFFEKVKISLKNCYDTLKYEYKGDFLFLGIYDNFKKGLNINQQSACLGIIVYFFTICELFEK